MRASPPGVIGMSVRQYRAWGRTPRIHEKSSRGAEETVLGTLEKLPAAIDASTRIEFH
jgi:hypothetical protein